MNKEFLKIAEEILENIDNYTGRKKEFYVRTGISRAYYGLIWYLRDRLSKQGYNFKKKNLHSHIPKVLASMGRFDLIEDFETLKAQRNDADYRARNELLWLTTLDKRALRTYIKEVHLFISRLGV